mmetsp:Transcript_8930/g.13706  ORF Transcript_8930/g.13706 Transcript_8930/m.13706 type:complete len:324 (+) Transcript_8930:100-1071(+)
MAFGQGVTAPKFSKEDEEREIADLTPEECHNIADDIFGHNACEVESRNREEVTDAQLQAFHDAMDRVSIEERAAYMTASVLSPELLETECSPVLFLQCEDYDPDRAAKRMAIYWTKRVEFFGEERAFLPMTLTGAMGDARDLEMIKNNPHVLYILPSDSSGRGVICGDRTTGHVSDRMCGVRLCWYVVHLALKNEMTRLRGIVIVCICKRYSKLKNYDRLRNNLIIKSYKSWLPVKLRAFHVCSPNNSFLEMILPVHKVFMDRNMRQRMKVHFGSEKHHLEDLTAYGLSCDALPPSVSGTYEPNPLWIEQQQQQDLEREQDAE